MWYIYIFEDKTIKVSQNPPTPGDIVTVGEGLLDVIQCQGEPKIFDNTASLELIERTKLESGYNV